MYLFNGVGIGSVSWVVFVRNLLLDDQNFKKIGDFEMGEDQISSGESFFLFYQSNLMPHFVPVSPDTTDNFIRLFEHFSVNLYDIRFFLYVPDIWMNTLLNLFRVNF